MYEYIRNAAVMYPKNIAYEYFGKKLSYEHFLENIDIIARSLKSIGVKEDDKVSICMPNTPEAIIMFYAINKIGAVANMIHPLSAEKEIEFYLKKSKSEFLLTIDLAYDKVKSISKKYKFKKVIVASPDNDMDILMKMLYKLASKSTKMELDTKTSIYWKDFINLADEYNKETLVHRKDSDLAAILYSGGTTGDPKGIMLTNLCFNAVALQCKYMVKPKDGESILSIMPIFHAFGLGICIHTPLTLGVKCILVPQVRPRKINSIIEKKKPNFIAVVPSLFEVMIKDKKLKKNALTSVTCCVCGGDFLNYDLKKKSEQFLKEHGSNAVIRIGYGLTESTGATCISPIENYKTKCIGFPFPDNLYKIVKIGTHDEELYGNLGEICISGPSIMTGYLDDEEQTAQTLRIHSDGKIWLHTGDIGFMDKDGLVYFESRLKRVIISSGYNIYPSYIEELVNKHPKVETSVAIGMDHEIKGQVIKLIIVLKDGIKATKDIKNDIESYCKKNIAKYAHPYIYSYKTYIPRK